jgi:hypothetical protein
LKVADLLTRASLYRVEPHELLTPVADDVPASWGPLTAER